MILLEKKIVSHLLTRKTTTTWLLHTAEAFSVLFVAVLLFNTCTSTDDLFTGTTDLLIRILLVASCWWLSIHLFRRQKLHTQFIVHSITLVLFSTSWILVITNFFGQATLTNHTAGAFNFLFLIVLLYCIALAGFHLWNFRARSIAHRARAQEWKRLANQGDVQVLKAQIQPHFLFNTLNRINASIPPQQEETRELIAKLADTFRYALQATKEDEVLLADELRFIQTYLELEKERFADRLQINITAAQDVLGARIAPMLLQPLVENAVIHGIGPSIDGGQISVHCQPVAGRIQISISNTGARYIGPVEWLMEGKGVGLRNTALRLEKIYQQQMKIGKNSQGGLTFTFSIPATA
ncbi:histidine kinase [Paraflavitalea sp. CAU 1676]|uniref:sensor histidine kinase n=1 Tax=Paraflavitalea sp. CAU 1676 TaxID=3032598 RepID=UPI0023DCAD51|nr:histidine kinase [Paraflavitalea sp. CAU 1676]MDF2189159.1 histidine kinase [Paraflavitalea sp. CAU 1676]